MSDFNPEKSLLALDFDGVIVNSIEECLVVGYNSLQKYLDLGGAINGLSELEKEQVFASRRMRNFIRHSEDYVFIFYALLKNVNIQSQDKFDHFLKQYSDLKDTFREIFYRERSRFLETNPARWLELNPLYPGMRDFLHNYQYSKKLFIVTTKKAKFVEATLAAADTKLQSANLFSADRGLSKTEIIANLLQAYSIQPHDFYFVDDQVDTLIKVRSLGINLYLARWGYTNKDQVQLAKQEEIAGLSRADFFKRFGN